MESHHPADIANAEVVVAQQLPGVVHPDFSQKPSGGNVLGLGKEMDEPGGAQIRAIRQFLHRPRIHVLLVHERDDAINAVVTAPVRRLLQRRLLAQDVVQELLKHARTDALILCVLALKLHGDPLEQIDHMAALAHVDAEAASGQQRIDHVRHAIAGAVHPIHRAILSVVIGVAMRRMRRDHHHLP